MPSRSRLALKHERDYSPNTIVTQDPDSIADVNSAENVDLSTIGGRVRWLRQKRELSQATLAAHAQVSQSTIGNIEAGLRKKPREILTLAKVLQTNPDWLETGRGDWQIASSSNANVFDPLSEEERRLIADFRALLEEDQERYAEEIATRATRMRAYTARVTGGAELARPSDESLRPTAAASTFVQKEHAPARQKSVVRRPK